MTFSSDGFSKRVLLITTSSNEDRLKGNILIFEFELTKEEEQKIAELGRLRKVCRFYATKVIEKVYGI